MPTERRYDSANLAKGVRLDKRGFAEVPAFVTRTGVLSYRRQDGSVVRELRHPDDVFRADSLETLRGASVTVGHPGGGLEWVSPDNADKHEVGVVASASLHPVEGKYVDAVMSVRRKDIIRRVDTKDLVECSAAYDCDVVAEAGTFDGQPYDQRQTNIVYNHVALLPAGKGRAGSDVRMRADSADAVLVDDAAPPAPPKSPAPPAPAKESPMALIKKRVDGVEYEVPETAASMLDKLIGERDTQQKRADKAESERDVMKADLDKVRDPKAVAALVSGRVALEQRALKVLGGDKRFDGKTDREVQEEVLAKLQPEYKREGRSDDAIAAAFDFAVANTKGKNLGLSLVRSAIDVSEQRSDDDVMQPKFQRADGKELTLEQSLAELETKRLNAWTGGK
jgi:uncharacterized protein